MVFVTEIQITWLISHLQPQRDILACRWSLALTCNDGGEILKDKENAEAKEKEGTKAPCDWEM